MRVALKRTAHVLATIAAMPWLTLFWTLCLIGSKDNALSSCSQVLSLVPGVSGCYLRAAFYHLVLDEFHPSARIEFGVLLAKSGARIGENVYVGPYCSLGLVTLERDVLLGPAVQIPSGPLIHGIESLTTPIRCQPGTANRVTVGQDCWIGGQSMVLANIAEQTVVGAGSVVTRPLPPRVIAAGNPARVIRSRSASESTQPLRDHLETDLEQSQKATTFDTTDAVQSNQ